MPITGFLPGVAVETDMTRPPSQHVRWRTLAATELPPDEFQHYEAVTRQLRQRWIDIATRAFSRDFDRAVLGTVGQQAGR